MRVFVTTSLLAGLLASPIVTSAEDTSTSLSYIAYLERYVTVQPATEEEQLEALINMPIVSGDRIDTARQARVEVQLADGAVVWVDEYTSVCFDAMALSRDADSERTVLYLSEGTLIVAVPTIPDKHYPMRVDGPGGTVYLTEPGLYRLAAAEDGVLVAVRNGAAEAATPEGAYVVAASVSVEVVQGRLFEVTDDSLWSDEFALWVDQRQQLEPGESVTHTDEQYLREASQLDNYGTWVWLENSQSWAWRPTVADSWRPYTWGRWYWTPTGWSWVAYEPWGWMPYHYGSWYLSPAVGWVWLWDPYWSPASVDWLWWSGHVAWCPRGYYSHYWWNRWYWDDYNHHGSSGPGIDRPSRHDVRPGARHARGGDDTWRVPASRFAIDVNGRVSLGSVDPGGWTVVATRDFASPHLSRLARSGRQVLPTLTGQTGVASSRPLITAAPRRTAVSTAIETSFRSVSNDANIDITPILARSGSLSRTEATGLVRQTTLHDLTLMTPSERMRADSFAEVAASRTTGGSWHTTPNVHRPRLYSAPSGVLGRSTQRPTTTIRSLSPTDSSSGTAGRRSVTSGSRSLRSVPSGSSMSRPSTSSPRPVIIPRTTGTTRSSSATSRTSSGSSSSSQATSTRSSSSSSRSSASSSHSSSSSSRSSASSSRSSSSSSHSSSSSSRSSSSSSRSTATRKR